MSLMPEFELGLWNAWIITVLGFILPWFPSFARAIGDLAYGLGSVFG
jgi:hypothetical protein